MIQNTDSFFEYAKSVNTPITQRDMEMFSQYFDMVVETNKTFNLTAITEEHDFVIKHLIDSIVGISEIPQNATLCDIGAGAGFPSIPIAIMRPDVTVYPLDSTAKKMDFVANCAKQLRLNNVHTIVGRAEEQSKLFGTFDAVCARAVSSLNILLEIAMPLLKIGGVFIAYKTDESELEGVKNALNTLYTKHIRTKSLSLPNGDSRAVLVFEKVGATPKQYPRQYGAIKKRPL